MISTLNDEKKKKEIWQAFVEMRLLSDDHVHLGNIAISCRSLYSTIFLYKQPVYKHLLLELYSKHLLSGISRETSGLNHLQ